MPGQHNVLNCLAAIAIADELEVPLDVMKEALATFRGVARRFTVVAEIDDIALVDDYGHHPAEVVATLAAARKAFDGRVIVAFQPHRHTRTHHLFDDFTRAFNQADRLFLLDIYAAGEAAIPGVSSERLARAVSEHGHHAVSYVGDRAALPRLLADEARPGGLRDRARRGRREQGSEGRRENSRDQAEGSEGPMKRRSRSKGPSVAHGAAFDAPSEFGFVTSDSPAPGAVAERRSDAGRRGEPRSVRRVRDGLGGAQALARRRRRSVDFGRDRVGRASIRAHHAAVFDP